MTPDARPERWAYTDLMDGALMTLLTFVGRSPGASIASLSGCICVAGPDSRPLPLVNAVMRVDRSVEAEMALSEAYGFFDALDRRFVIWAAAHGDYDLAEAASRAGLTPDFAASGPCMAVTHPPEAPVLGRRRSVRRMETRRDAAEFAAIIDRAFLSDRVSPGPFTRIFADGVTSGGADVIALALFVDDTPTSSALIVNWGPGAALFWVGTVPIARGRGFGELITRVAVRTAFELGAKYVVLQSAPRAVSLYKRVGFKAFSALTAFTAPAPASRAGTT